MGFMPKIGMNSIFTLSTKVIPNLLCFWYHCLCCGDFASRCGWFKM